LPPVDPEEPLDEPPDDPLGELLFESPLELEPEPPRVPPDPPAGNAATSETISSRRNRLNDVDMVGAVKVLFSTQSHTINMAIH
jgi:hypothetical protein